YQRKLDLEHLRKLFERYLEVDEAIVGGVLYRARVQKDNTAIPIDKMGKPPPEGVKNGRANPAGIPYLYTASTPETAIAEIRPHPSELISVVKYEVTNSLRLIDLTNPHETISMSPIGEEEDDLLAMRHSLDLLSYLGNELSKPILPRAAELEYLPTQYFCEYIKNCEKDGVVYRSSIGSGINVALFADNKVRAVDLTLYEVTAVSYSQRRI
ncbi:MAG: RES family NAD+ phosphorylase, partial [Candidatus Glassbacteria bacterium]